MQRLQLRPKPWTHHHVHRLFHLSMGLCFGFAALVMATGMAVSLRAGAYDISIQGDVVVSAEVEGVNPGPTSGSVPDSNKPPVPTSNPTVTITAEPQGQIPTRTLGTGSAAATAYVFNTQRPAFSGTTSVSNGIIFIYIEGPTILHSTVRATADGNWYWQSPDQLKPGTYVITASVFDSYDLTRSGNASTYFIVELQSQPPQSGQPGQPGQPAQPGQPGNPPPVEQPPAIPPIPTSDQIFGIFFTIQDQSKVTQSGTDVIGWVTMVSNSDYNVTDQIVHYQVISPKQKVILDTRDTVSFSQQLQYMKTFHVAPLTPAGKYTVRVSSTYKGVESVTSDTFMLKEAPTAATVAPQGPTIIWGLLLLLLLLFLFLVYLAYRYVRHHTDQIKQGQSEPIQTI